MRTNSEIMDILDQLKSEKGLSISEIARRTNLAKSAVSRYFKRSREFPLNRVEDFAKAFNVTSEYLLGMENELPDNLIKINSLTKIPILGEIACGEPILAEENISGYIDEPTEFLPKGDLFYLKAKGESMMPAIASGSYVLIRQQPEVEDGEIAAVRVNSDTEATLKRVKHQGDLVMLMPDNPIIPPIIITEDNPATIIGKALKIVTML